MSDNASWALSEPKPGSVRRHNLGVVLRVLHTSGPRTRAELVAGTELAKATVASLVGDLLSAELIGELEVRYTGQTGRPSRRLAVTGEWVIGIGIAVHDDRLVGVATDLTGKRIDEVATRLDPGIDAGGVMDELTSFVEAFVERLVPSGQSSGRLIAGICVVMPPSAEAHHFGHRQSPSPTVDLAEFGRRLQSVAGLGPDVALTSLPEAGAAALAEQHSGSFGVGSFGVGSFGVGSFGSGANLISIGGHGELGAGIVLDGRLRLGHTGTLGRVGHLVVNPLGGRCPCGGRGCWGTVIGLAAIVGDVAPDLMSGPSTAMEPYRSVAEIVDRANAGDELVLDGLEHAGQALGLGLASIIPLFDPEAIVLFGYLRQFGPWLVPPAEATLLSRWGDDALAACGLQLSSVVGDPAAVGASQWATRLVYEDPLSLMRVT